MLFFNTGTEASLFALQRQINFIPPTPYSNITEWKRTKTMPLLKLSHPKVSTILNQFYCPSPSVSLQFAWILPPTHPSHKNKTQVSRQQQYLCSCCN